MPISESKLVTEVHDRMRRGGKSVFTITWPDFYSLNEATKLKQARLDKIQSEAKEKFNLIVGYGNNVVLFGLDTNHSSID